MTETVEGVVELVPGKLYALGGSFELQGRTSWLPPDARGTHRCSCYLLLEDSEALLIDTGPAVFRELILSQLRSLLPSGSELSIFLSRAELETTGNLTHIASAIPVKAVHTGGVPNVADGFNLITLAQGYVSELPIRRTLIGTSLPLGLERRLEVFAPALRMLSAYWVYDTGTQTLFPSDAFGYTIDSPVLGSDEAWRNLTSRYWWLPGAHTEKLVEDLRAIFESRPIEIIAPVHGCILRGRELVRTHYELMQELLDRHGALSRG